MRGLCFFLQRMWNRCDGVNYVAMLSTATRAAVERKFGALSAGNRTARPVVKAAGVAVGGRPWGQLPIGWRLRHLALYGRRCGWRV